MCFWFVADYVESDIADYCLTKWLAWCGWVGCTPRKVRLCHCGCMPRRVRLAVCV